jgi:copper(I)-binding protein
MSRAPFPPLMEIPMKFARSAAVAVAMLAAAPLAAAHAADIEAIRPWSRPAASGGNGAGYVTLVNHGKADALVAVDMPDAQKVEMHASSMAGGIMKMTPDARTPIPAKGQVSFAPGGRHLMLIGLKRPLKVGDRVAATLKFASGATLKVGFVVQAQPPVASGQASGMSHMPGM